MRAVQHRPGAHTLARGRRPGIGAAAGLAGAERGQGRPGLGQKRGQQLRDLSRAAGQEQRIKPKHAADQRAGHAGIDRIEFLADDGGVDHAGAFPTDLNRYAFAHETGGDELFVEGLGRHGTGFGPGNIARRGNHTRQHVAGKGSRFVLQALLCRGKLDIDGHGQGSGIDRRSGIFP